MAEKKKRSGSLVHMTSERKRNKFPDLGAFLGEAYQNNSG